MHRLHGQRERLVGIECQCPVDGLFGQLEVVGVLFLGHHAPGRNQVVSHRQHGPCACELGVQLDRPLQQTGRFLHVTPVNDIAAALQKKLIGIHIAGVRFNRDLARVELQA